MSLAKLRKSDRSVNMKIGSLPTKTLSLGDTSNCRLTSVYAASTFSRKNEYSRGSQSVKTRKWSVSSVANLIFSFWPTPSANSLHVSIALSASSLVATGNLCGDSDAELDEDAESRGA